MSNAIPPALPLTYPDAVCVLDLDAYGTETTSDLQTLVQDVYHILLETPGSNIDLPTRGVGVKQYLSGPTASLTALSNKIETEMLEDDRIDTCTSKVTQDSTGAYILKLQIGVGGTVLGLSFAYTQAGGLLPTGIQWPDL